MPPASPPPGRTMSDVVEALLVEAASSHSPELGVIHECLLSSAILGDYFVVDDNTGRKTV